MQVIQRAAELRAVLDTERRCRRAGAGARLTRLRDVDADLSGLLDMLVLVDVVGRVDGKAPAHR